jgi:hypothetical protein
MTAHFEHSLSVVYFAISWARAFHSFGSDIPEQMMDINAKYEQVRDRIYYRHDDTDHYKRNLNRAWQAAARMRLYVAYNLLLAECKKRGRE